MNSREQIRAVLEEIESSADEMLGCLSDLVAAESVTGEEGPAAEALADWYRRCELETEFDLVDPAFRDRFPAFSREVDLESRPNVYGWWRSGDSDRPPLVLNGHTDVVPALDRESWTDPPFGGVRRDGRIWGRGTTDMKGGLVAALFAVRALRRVGVQPTRDVQLQGVIAEETGGLGALWALETQPRPAAVIVLEPTRSVVAPACAGNQQFRVTVSGARAHTSVPWQGVSAAEKLWVVYRALDDFTRKRNAEISHPLFAHLPMAAPSAVGIFRAGEHVSMIPDSGELAGRYGVMPGESLEEVQGRLVAAIEAAAAADEWLSQHPPEIEWLSEGFPAWETASDHDLVRALAEGSREATGAEAVEAFTYASDAGHFAAVGVPALLLGPGQIEDAHRVDESVAEEQMLLTTRTLGAGLVTYLTA